MNFWFAIKESDNIASCIRQFQDFFIADGEGLPRTLVEKEAKFAEEILGLYSLPVSLSY